MVVEAPEALVKLPNGLRPPKRRAQSAFPGARTPFKCRRRMDFARRPTACSDREEHFAILGQRPEVVGHAELQRVARLPYRRHCLCPLGREEPAALLDVGMETLCPLNDLHQRIATLPQRLDQLTDLVRRGYLRNGLDPR